MKSFIEIFLNEKIKIDAFGDYEFIFKNEKGLFKFVDWAKKKGFHIDLIAQKEFKALVKQQIYNKIPNLEKIYNKFNK